MSENDYLHHPVSIQRVACFIFFLSVSWNDQNLTFSCHPEQDEFPFESRSY